MSVSCRTCGREWPRDPALEVVCPNCRAKVGQQCRRPSGHGCDIHNERDQLALDQGVMHICPGPLVQWSPEIAWLTGVITTEANLVERKRHRVTVYSHDRELTTLVAKILHQAKAQTKPNGWWVITSNWRNYTDLLSERYPGVYKSKPIVTRHPPHDYYFDYLRGFLEGGGPFSLEDAPHLRLSSPSIGLLYWMKGVTLALSGIDCPEPTCERGGPPVMHYRGEDAIKLAQRIWSCGPSAAQRRPPWLTSAREETHIDLSEHTKRAEPKRRRSIMANTPQQIGLW